MNSLTKLPRKDLWTWLPLVLLILIVIAIRGFILFRDDLMGGVNGMYYPVQVRAILESGKLGFPDLPLVFYLEAFVAKISISIFGGDSVQSIITASKLVNMILPALTAIPVFLLSREVLSEGRGRRWVPLLVSSFATLYFFSLFGIAELQKTAIGLAWVMFFFYFIYKAMQYGGVKNPLLAGLFFGLTGLTSLGCLGTIIVFLVLIIFFSLIFDKEKRLKLLKVIPTILGGFLVLITIFYFIDPERIERLLGVFLLSRKLFEDNMFSYLTKGEGPIVFMKTAPALLGNFLSIFNLILFFRKRRFMVPSDKVFYFSLILLLILLGFPLLGLEWLCRLSLMAHIPVSITLMFAFRYIRTNWKRVILIMIMIIIIFLPLIPITLGPQKWCISKKAYHDLIKVKNAIRDPNSTLVVTRHGLEWWSAWVLGTDVAQQNVVTNATFDAYDDVLYLVQLKGTENVGPGPGQGQAGSQFPEVFIPENAETVYRSDYFILARVSGLPGGD